MFARLSSVVAVIINNKASGSLQYGQYPYEIRFHAKLRSIPLSFPTLYCAIILEFGTRVWQYECRFQILKTRTAFGVL